MIDHAIVLKNYFPKKNKITILHARFGKINFYVDEKHQAARLCNGSLMYCQIIKKQTSYQCEFIDAYFVPFQDGQYDLYFIHDILKICLLFMPDQMSMADVFDLITGIYQELDDLQVCHKKIYLLKLFLYLGIFPENKKLYQHIMQDNKLHTHDSDILLQQALNYCWNSDGNYS
ncbi:hypothetical protein KBC04_04285 [Candidatus Babeliales bacterium]|nr:hypothetical protein [Candidatus Babeliales bacterium]MBP9844284.1 hypothetical protein [Candidatus Babeliales bacterium]